MKNEEQARGLTQKQAAAYVGVSVRFFRDNVHVRARCICAPKTGQRPLLRYFREELDAWMDRWGKPEFTRRSR
jgi:hypothetical protein